MRPEPRRGHLQGRGINYALIRQAVGQEQHAPHAVCALGTGTRRCLCGLCVLESQRQIAGRGRVARRCRGAERSGTGEPSIREIRRAARVNLGQRRQRLPSCALRRRHPLQHRLHLVVVDDHAQLVVVFQQPDGVGDGLPREVDLPPAHGPGAVEDQRDADARPLAPGRRAIRGRRGRRRRDGDGQIAGGRGSGRNERAIGLDVHGEPLS